MATKTEELCDRAARCTLSHQKSTKQTPKWTWHASPLVHNNNHRGQHQQLHNTTREGTTSTLQDIKGMRHRVSSAVYSLHCDRLFLSQFQYIFTHPHCTLVKRGRSNQTKYYKRSSQRLKESFHFSGFVWTMPKPINVISQ